MERGSDSITSNSVPSSGNLLSETPSLPTSLFPKQYVLFLHSFLYYCRIFFFLVQYKRVTGFFPSLNFFCHSLTLFLHSDSKDACHFITSCLQMFLVVLPGGRFAWIQLQFNSLIVSSVSHMKIRVLETLLANLSAYV